MEENTNEVIEVVEEVPLLDPGPNKNWVYQPSEYELRGYQDSWKKCYCGRQTWFNDNYCPACGQRLGKPENYGEE